MSSARKSATTADRSKRGRGSRSARPTRASQDTSQPVRVGGPTQTQLAYAPLTAQWDPLPAQRTEHEPADGDSKEPRRGLWTFLTAYGWRAYAIPVLLVLTAWVIFDGLNPSPNSAQAGPDPRFGELSGFGVRATDSAGVIGAPPKGNGAFAASIATGALPPGGDFTPQGANTWHIVPGTTGQVGAGTWTTFTYTVEVEDGVDTSRYGDEQAFARMVDATLADPKGWTNDKRFAFRRIDSGEPSFRISLTSQMTTRGLCGFEIEIDSNCYNQNFGRVVLEEARWVRGALAFQGDIGSYRQYQINHEVGHAIGYHEHQPCDEAGALAPIMMQQTFGTANDDIARLDPIGVVPMDGKVCRYNPWPYPRG